MISSCFLGFRSFFRANLFWVLLVGLGVFVFVELVGAFSWLANLVAHGEFFDFQLFRVLGFLVPCLFLVFLYSWVWIPSFSFLREKFGGTKQKKNFSFLFEENVLDKKLLFFVLIVFLLVSGFLAYFPNLTSHGSILVGSDSFHYFEVLSRMVNEGPLFVFGTDRPLTYLVLFFVNFLVGFSEVFAVQVAPVLLACCLFLGVFWCVRVGTKNDVLALVCGVFTSFSFHFTVSVYAYFLANWIGLFLVFLVFGFLFKAIKEKSVVFLTISCLFGFGVFLSHPYTWYVLTGSLFLFLVWNLLKLLSNMRFENKVENYFLGIFLGGNCLFFIIYSLLPFGESSVGSASGLANSLLAVFDFSNLLVFDVVADSVLNALGGFFVNPVLLLLSVFGIFLVFRYNVRFVRFFVFWVVSISLMMFVVGSGNFFAYRFLYLIPFQVFAGLGFYKLLIIIKGEKLFSNSQKNVLKGSLVVGVGLSFLNYVFVSLSSVPFFVL